MLAKQPEFSTFNEYLIKTQLTNEINDSTTITVYVVDNSAMFAFLSKHFSIYSIKNILSLHVLLDYFGTKKIHQITNGTALAATMIQDTCLAPSSSGFVNITDLQGDKFSFTPEDNDSSFAAHFIKFVVELPYNIIVIHINAVLPFAAVEAPTPGLAEVNLTGLMSTHGCKVFAETLLANLDTFKTFNEAVDGRITVFYKAVESLSLG